MELERLAGGRPQAAAAVGVRQIIEGQVQGRRNASGGAAQAQHHSPVLLFPLAAVVAVVLLVRPVELENLNRRLTERRPVGSQFPYKRIPEVVTGGLETLGLGEAVGAGI